MDNCDTDIKRAMNYFINEAGNKKKAAKKLGISPSYLGDILTGRRQYSDSIAKKLGFVKITFYLRVDGLDL